jgi:hypothetical protein
VPTLIVIADSETHKIGGGRRDRRAFQLKERLTSSDVSDPRLAAQLVERIGWALADAEDAERAAQSE